MADPINDQELKKIVDEVVTAIMATRPDNFGNTAKKIANAKEIAESKKLAIATNIANNKNIAIGTDHGGVALKEVLKDHLKNAGYQIIDCGTHSTDAVDYPDIAQAVAQKVSAGLAWRGIVIDGAGIGSCMAANKVKGVRAAMCYDHATANNSREHNDANVLSLGAGLIGQNLAKQIVDTFINTKFAGGRHAPRVNKIMEIER
jgi:ribose 5-phosphate isomerase B